MTLVERVCLSLCAGVVAVLAGGNPGRFRPFSEGLAQVYPRRDRCRRARARACAPGAGGPL